MAASEARLHHIDAARAVFLLLGIPFHVATTAIMVLSPEAPGFRTDPVIGLSLSTIHAFRMTAFFMLSGYFAAMMRERRGPARWLADRGLRIGVPLVASIASLAVIQYHFKVGLSALWAGGYHGLPLAFEHLWFLIVLLAFVAGLALLPARWPGAPEWARRALVLRGRAVPALLALLAAWGTGLATLVEVCGLQDNEIVFEQQLLIRTLQYAPAFVLGALAFDWRLGARLFNLPLGFHAVLALALLAAHVLLDPVARPALGLPMDLAVWQRVADGALMQPLGFLLSLVAFRLLARVASRPSRAVAFLVEGAMAIYLFHMTWTMAVVTVLARIVPQTGPDPAMAPVVQWLGSSAVVLVLSCMCFVVVRRNPLLAFAFCGVKPQAPVSGQAARA